MWAILKIDRKQIFLLKKDLEQKLNSNVKIYNPKICVEKYLTTKKKKEIKYNLLGDYVFCFSEKFNSKKNLATLNYSRGLKYFLKGFESSQSEISKFVQVCMDAENKDGFLTQKIFELKIDKYYKFLNGPFALNIFQLIEIQKNKIGFKLGKIKSYICKKDILFKPI
tara:strand:+ start:934 stop:1434 length:501 start_codon:yes stop_codon:yes gene_type:complete